MAMVFKCDRCGEIFNRKVPNINECCGTANSILFFDTMIGYDHFWIAKFQLCPSCMAKLNDWLKGEQK